MRLPLTVAAALLAACAHPSPNSTMTPGCGTPSSHCQVIIDSTPTYLPFSAAQNQDGSRFVAYEFAQTGRSYHYTRAQDVPKDKQFAEVSADSARPGDLAWWFRYMAVYYGKAIGTVLVSPGVQVKLENMDEGFGPHRFYRVVAPYAP